MRQRRMNKFAREVLYWVRYMAVIGGFVAAALYTWRIVDDVTETLVIIIFLLLVLPKENE